MSLTIQFDESALRPLVRLAVGEAMERLENERAKFSNSEAAR